MGSARLLGIRLMRNFDRPYAAPDIRAFWRRWHISLTRWFTDYVYIPLGGSRKGLPRQMLATTAVFALCGLWHGASWSFVVWGLLHAFFLNLHTLWRQLRPDRVSGWPERALALAAVCFSWLFFRAGDMSRAVELLGQLFSPWNLTEGAGLLMSAAAGGVSPAAALLLLLGGLAVLWRLPALTREGMEKKVPEAVWAGLLLAIGVAVFIRLDAGIAGAFIYFQF